MARVFLLSPANAGGERAAMLTSPAAMFSLARRLRSRTGAPLGEVMSFVSGLYFRGKLAYARAWARPAAAVRVIVPGRGLLTPDVPVTREELLDIAAVPVDLDDPRYREPLARDARALAADHPEAAAILLGSIATGKYVDTLVDTLGDRLRVPSEFIGMGDMRRGALLLRCVKENRELEYVPAASAVSVLTRVKLRARANSENAGRRMPWRIG